MSEKQKRIVVDVSPELSKKVKAKAATLGLTITKIVTDFLIEWVK